MDFFIYMYIATTVFIIINLCVTLSMIIIESIDKKEGLFPKKK